MCLLWWIFRDSFWIYGSKYFDTKPIQFQKHPVSLRFILSWENHIIIPISYARFLLLCCFLTEAISFIKLNTLSKLYWNIYVNSGENANRRERVPWPRYVSTIFVSLDGIALTFSLFAPPQTFLCETNLFAHVQDLE